MQTIQIALADNGYAKLLRSALARSGSWDVVCCNQPDEQRDGVLVLDADALDQLPKPLTHPERVVLITQRDADHLAHAWEAGITSVVYLGDSPGTAVLAIMAATLRSRPALLTNR